ncbi:tetratricopeptide repeat domain protein [Verrucomicrobiia bacterium DG1235]|nr:tetratricopeptide repeat domain protein [Verrucomicrobiae bacterium DG1235]
MPPSLNSRPLLYLFSLSILLASSVSQLSAIGVVSKDKKDDETNFEELNFTFDNPGWPWVSINATTLSEDATVAYRKTINDAYFLIIGEKVGVEYGFTSEDLVESSKSNMMAISQNVEFSESTKVQINGIEWLNFTGKVSLMGEPLVYGYLIHAKNGFGYQLITWRSGEFPELAKSDILQLGENFKLVDPELVHNSEEFEPVASFQDAATGFSIDLAGENWTTWPIGPSEFPAAVFTATKANEIFFFAVPLYHEGLNPSFKDLKNGLLAHLFNVDTSNGLKSRDRIVREDGERFLQSSLSFESYYGDTNHLLIQVRRLKGFSYLLGAYSLDESLLTDVEPIFGKVQIDEAIDVERISQTLSQEVKYFQSQTLNQLAINVYSQNNYVNAKRFLERALEFDTSDPAIATNFAAVANDQGDFQSIIDLFKAAPDDFAENVQFLEYYALALYRSNQTEDAEKVYLEVFDTGNMSEAGLYAYMEMLALQERWADGVAIAEDFSDLTGSQLSRQWTASFCIEIEEYEKSLAILDELKDEMPFDLSIDYDIGNTYLSQEKYSKTLDYIESLGEEIDSYPMLYTLQGNALFGLKSYVKAKESYQKAVELNPVDEEAKTMLEYATLALGKGDTDVNNTPIAPVACPDALMAIGYEMEDKASESKESEILYTLLSIHYEKEKLSKQTRRTKVAIRDDAGLDAYSTLSFSFDPFFEEVYVNEIIVRNANGDVIGRESREDFYILDDSTEEIISQDRALYAPVSGLTKDSTLEYTVTYNTTGLIDEFPLRWESFTYFQKSLLCGVSVAGETGSVASYASDGVSILEDESALIWYAQDVPNYKVEYYQADLETFAPHLVLAENSKNWKSEVDEYFDEIADRLVTSDKIAELSSSLLAGAESEKDKVAAIYGYIQKEFTYKALAFGPRAQIPNTADQVVSDKYGDCKDLALLANRLLDAAGIQSYLALVNTGARIKTELPSLDQFDHMILYLPKHEGGHFIDCTSQHVSLELSTPLGLDERQILILDWDDPRFVESKAQVLEENTINAERVVELVDEELRVEETLRLTGLPAAFFRSYLSGIQESQTLDTFQALMSSRTNLNLRLENVETQDTELADKPLRIVMRYNIPRAIKQTSRGFTLSALPSIWEHYYLEVPFVRDRKTPFEIRTPLRFDSRVTMVTPPGTRLSHSAIIDVKEDTGYHVYSHSRVADESLKRITVNNSIQLLAREGAPDRFDAFQNSAHDALSLVGDSLEFEFAQ